MIMPIIQSGKFYRYICMFINKYQFKDDNNKSSTISEDAKVLILGIGNGLKEKEIAGSLYVHSYFPLQPNSPASFI